MDTEEVTQYYESFIGQRVYKFNKKKKGSSGRFKSGFVHNTIRGVEKNPHTGNIGFTFVEDESIVDANRLKIKDTNQRICTFSILADQNFISHESEENKMKTASQTSKSIKKARKNRLLRDTTGDTFCCYWCDKEFPKSAATLEHIDEKFRPVNDPSNLALACSPCNQTHSVFQNPEPRKYTFTIYKVAIPEKLAKVVQEEGIWKLDKRPDGFYKASVIDVTLFKKVTSKIEKTYKICKRVVKERYWKIKLKITGECQQTNLDQSPKI